MHLQSYGLRQFHGLSSEYLDHLGFPLIHWLRWGGDLLCLPSSYSETLHFISLSLFLNSFLCHFFSLALSQSLSHSISSRKRTNQNDEPIFRFSPTKHNHPTHTSPHHTNKQPLTSINIPNKNQRNINFKVEKKNQSLPQV